MGWSLTISSRRQVEMDLSNGTGARRWGTEVKGAGPGRRSKQRGDMCRGPEARGDTAQLENMTEDRAS